MHTALSNLLFSVHRVKRVKVCFLKSLRKLKRNYCAHLSQWQHSPRLYFVRAGASQPVYM